jgi:hypothetical protein
MINLGASVGKQNIINRNFQVLFLTKYNMTVEGRNGLLVIRTCSYQDAGEYVCNVAHNYTKEIRLMSKTSKLFVECK